MEDWIDRCAAMKRLGIKQQTLYAYVSRDRIAVRADPVDPRKSLYSAADIENLRSRQKRGRGRAAVASGAMAWGEPSLETAISTVHRGRLIYRGEDAATLSESANWETVAELLWQTRRPLHLSSSQSSQNNPFAALAGLVPNGFPTVGLSNDKMIEDGRTTISNLASAFGAAPTGAPLHERLADGWSLPEAAGDPLRRALVLLADHELNASTFAVRVAASTGASIAACVMAGLSALSGPRHGGAGAAALALLDDARLHGAEIAVRQVLSSQRYVPGFGHNLYPGGDPRAAALFEALPNDPLVDELRLTAEAVCGLRPNIDFALATLTRWAGMPEDATFRLFALARSCGWVAHAIEQVNANTLIRPRARYVGVLPD